jgi:hypothetical protein
MVRGTDKELILGFLGTKYVGEYKDGKEHGQGTKTWGNGDKYAGEWKDGKEHGQGTHTWGKGQYKGDKYVGEFKDGLLHGKGTYTNASDGTVSKGLWEDNNLIIKFTTH